MASGKRCRLVLVALSLVWRLECASLSPPGTDVALAHQKDPERPVARAEPQFYIAASTNDCQTYRENQKMLVTCQPRGKQPQGSTVVAYLGDEALEMVDPSMRMFGRWLALADSGKQVFCVDSTRAPKPPARSEKTTVVVLNPAPKTYERKPRCEGGNDHVRARVKAGGGHLVYAWTYELGMCLDMTKYNASPPTPLGNGEFEYILWLSRADSERLWGIFADYNQGYELYINGKKVFGCVTKSITPDDVASYAIIFIFVSGAIICFYLLYQDIVRNRKSKASRSLWHGKYFCDWCSCENEIGS